MGERTLVSESTCDIQLMGPKDPLDSPDKGEVFERLVGDKCFTNTRGAKETNSLTRFQKVFEFGNVECLRCGDCAQIFLPVNSNKSVHGSSYYSSARFVF